MSLAALFELCPSLRPNFGDTPPNLAGIFGRIVPVRGLRGEVVWRCEEEVGNFEVEVVASPPLPLELLFLRLEMLLFYILSLT